MRLLLLLLLILQSNSLAELYTINSVDEIEGNELIRLQMNDSAKSVITTYSYSDSGYLYLKKGELAFQEKNYSDAKRFLLQAIARSEQYKPFAYRRIGDVELALGEISYAIVAYRTAAQLSSMKSYSYFLNELADSLGGEHAEELSVSGWHTLLFPDSASPEVKDTLLPQLVALLDTTLTYPKYDSLYQIASKANLAKDFEFALKDTSLIDTSFGTSWIFKHAKYLSSRGYFSVASRWLHKSLERDDFSKTVSDKEYLTFRTELNYALKNWSNVVKWGKAYFDKYGYTSNLIYSVARAYRRMGNMENANYWYDLHVKRYPKTQRSHDILWYQAWIYEDKGSFDTAIVHFQRLSEKFGTYKYGDDALFRVGLLHFRMKEYKKSIEAFSSFQKRFTKSRLFAGSYYWQGRAYSELKDSVSAAKAYDKVESEWPLDYFAWRARQARGTMADFKIETTEFDPWYTALKERSKNETDTLSMSVNDSLFELGVKLGTIGYSDEALLLLEPFEIRGHKNYAQLFELSGLYNMIGDHYRAFKISKSIFWALPSELKTALPLEYLDKLYPKVFPVEIDEATQRFGVEQHLVRAIMRQESMFSPTIESYVGAVGLMQIMPYTGEEIANDLDTAFERSMLYNPKVNVTFGTHYIGKLLKQFDGEKVQAIASYNGGPHNVKKWVARSSDVLEDEPYFSECIGFSETRNYVKRVLENYWIYETLERQFRQDSSESESLSDKPQGDS